MAVKATRRRIRRWGRFPESAAERPHFSSAPHHDGGPSFFPKEHNACPENALLGYLSQSLIF